MYLTFDVETNGLHGEAFAFGYVLTDRKGNTVKEGFFACSLRTSEPQPSFHHNRTKTWDDDDFLEEVVVPAVKSGNFERCYSPEDLRLKFFNHWYYAVEIARKQDEPESIILVSDVPWPCEARFLLEVHQENPSFMCYPLLDVASMLQARGIDPTLTFDRMPHELPSHNPLNDSRQSSRIFHSLMKGEPIWTK